MELALEEVGRVTDAELVRQLECLVKADRALTAKLLVHLGELAERELYLARGYSSMFDYCRSALQMSEAEAYLRIQAAKAGRRFPLVLVRLAAGLVHLSGIKLLAPHLTEENHVRLLDRVRGMSKKQIEGLIAELAPKPDVPARMRKVPSRRAPTAGSLLESRPLSAAAQSSTTDSRSVDSPTAVATTFALQFPAKPEADVAAGLKVFALQPPHARASTKALSPGRFKLEVTLGQEAHDKLEQLQELLRHQNPTGDLARIVERALSELLERETKRRFAQTKSAEPRVADKLDQAKHETEATDSLPRVSREIDRADHVKGTADARPVGSRYIPREVVREVYARDAGQCTFVSAEGRRCSARGFVELHHHETTFARGGKPTADNLRLACRAHNKFLAQRDYGREFMQRKLREAQGSRSGNSQST